MESSLLLIFTFLSVGFLFFFFFFSCLYLHMFSKYLLLLLCPQSFVPSIHHNAYILYIINESSHNFLWQLALVTSHAALSSEEYWNSILPNTPMPRIVKDLLQPGWLILSYFFVLKTLFVWKQIKI